jgi:2-oxo-4-hydroxy-4-carboxy-5-ureidoimidazoline decarboxylase
MEDTIIRLNALPADAAERELLACCASRRWARDVAAARPYASRTALVDASTTLIGALAWDDVFEALDAHPRIGDRAGGAEREAAWSRQEQAGVGSAPEDVLAALAEGNVAYERLFGHVFLICATGKSAPEMLESLNRRLGNSPVAEQDAVRGELAAITALRLARLLDQAHEAGQADRADEAGEAGETGEAGTAFEPATSGGGVRSMSLSTHVLDGARGLPAVDVPVRLDYALPAEKGEGWLEIVGERTDADGRIRFGTGLDLTTGTYRLVFDTAAYFAATGTESFYPEVAIAFRVTDPAAHYHVPLLLSPFAYSTYRGS